jgi:hypothetical protein
MGVISEVTQIDLQALQGNPLSDFSEEQRLSWAQNRQTTRIEDKAYCLLGILGVCVPLIYGEREHASIRLLDELHRRTESMFGSRGAASLRSWMDDIRQEKSSRETINSTGASSREVGYYGNVSWESKIHRYTR